MSQREVFQKRVKVGTYLDNLSCWSSNAFTDKLSSQAQKAASRAFLVVVMDGSDSAFLWKSSTFFVCLSLKIFSRSDPRSTAHNDIFFYKQYLTGSWVTLPFWSSTQLLYTMINMKKCVWLGQHEILTVGVEKIEMWHKIKTQEENEKISKTQISK